MIKINLARMSGVAPTHAETSVTSGGPARPSPLPAKLFMIFALPLALYFWQGSILSGKLKQMKVSEEKLNEIRTQVEKLGAVTAVVQGLSKEKERLQEQLAVIGKISSKRAFKLRTIAEMQKVLPGDCWLEEVLISKDRVNFKGYARTPSSVQTLVDGLERLDFLETAFNQEIKRTTLGQSNVHEFNVVAEVKK